MSTESNTKLKIKELKSRIDKGEDVIDVLERAFEDRTALVISAGPSAVRWKEVLNKLKEEDPVIICIKQSIFLAGEVCDIHFLNNANLVKYPLHKQALSIMTINSPYVPVFGKYDVSFKIMHEYVGLNKYSLAQKKNFETFKLSNTGIYRPVGPGIMYESVISTILHMGVKKITTIGWDVADDNGANNHFYDKGSFVQEDKRKVYSNDRFLYRFIKNAKLAVRLPFSYLFYRLGFSINKASMAEGEARIISESLPYLKEWLSSKGVELNVISNSKWMK